MCKNREDAKALSGGVDDLEVVAEVMEEVGAIPIDFVRQVARQAEKIVSKQVGICAVAAAVWHDIERLGDELRTERSIF